MIGKSLATVIFDWRRLELVLQFSARFFPWKSLQIYSKVDLNKLKVIDKISI